MKILYLCADHGIPILGRKGGAVHARELVAAFVRAGHQVIVAAPLATKSPWDDEAPLRAPLLRIELSPARTAAVDELKAFTKALGVSRALPGELRRILYDRELAAELDRRFRRHPPDLVYERASLYSTAGVQLANALGVPLAVELNAPLALEQASYRSSELGALAEAAERETLTGADAVLAVSAPLRDYAVALGADASRVHVLPNGVDASVFRPGVRDAALRGQLGLNGGPVLGFVSGLRPWHGLETLPLLLERLVPRHPEVRLVVVGDGPLRGQLESELRVRGLSANATFTGSLPHPQVAAVIREFDAGLAPYPEPGGHAFYFSPLKLFEYMACGIPVVGADIGQIADVVSDGETGILYPPGEVDALAAACDRLLEDPMLRERLGRAAAEHVRGRYTWDANAAQVASLASALGASSGGR